MTTATLGREDLFQLLFPNPRLTQSGNLETGTESETMKESPSLTSPWLAQPAFLYNPGPFTQRQHHLQ